VKPHQNTVISTLPFEITAFVLGRDDTRRIVPDKPLNISSEVDAVLLTKRDYEALLKVEKEYWKLHSRYHQAMNNCT
jgi:hypothetical protein